MSLLLDALKKAAEKKAKKDSAKTDAIDGTETIDDATLTQSAASDEVTATASFIDETEMGQETVVDATDVDSTELDKTQQTATDTTEIEAVTLANIQSEETQVDTTEHEPTELDETLQASTDTTEIEAETVANTRLEETQVDATEHEPTEVDKTLQTATDTTEIEAVTLANIQAEQTQVDDAELDDDQTTRFNDEDKTFFVTDEDDVLELSGKSVSSDQTQTITSPHETLRMQEAATEAELTNDDVTEFMGDGVRDEIEQDDISEPERPTDKGQDDTTLTNPDSLNLTQEEYDEDLSLTLYKDESDSTDTGSIDNIERTDTIKSYQDGIPEGQTETITDKRQRPSTVDIAKLTSDETVTVKDTTATRTFAPDNYDRTLLKLSDKDVSKIFPGMKSETTAVMTPDYAKKIFMRKSSSVKSYYYKIYAGIALTFLLVVLFWGMIGLQDESDTIDRNLAGLKRDPMPGIIKPAAKTDSSNLFAKNNTDQDKKAIELLAKVEDETISPDGVNTQQGEVDASLSEPETTDKPLNQDAKENEQARAIAPVKQVESRSNQGQSADKTDTSGTSKAASPIQLSSSSRVSDKDRLLQTAYTAYENGNIKSARTDYEKVLSIESDNRDALLGRAAIHILDNEYEQAIQMYQQLLEANPLDSMAMTSLISVANIDARAGETQLKTMLRSQPESAYLHFVLGNMYGSQNRWNEAQGSYFNALQYKPGDPNYAYNLAVSLEHIGKPESAVSYYQRAIDNESSGLATFDSRLVSQRIEVLSQ